jgi:acylphosphatase
MKLKIKIVGPKVHDVGYRYFLMSNAIDFGLKGFQARNRQSGKEQEVIALVEGDEEAIADFKELIGTQKPEHSGVSEIAFEDYGGEVMRAGEYAQVCTALQMNKAIPILLDIRDDTKYMKGAVEEIQENTRAAPQIAEDIEGLRKDLMKRSDDRLARMEKDIKTIKSKLGIR